MRDQRKAARRPVRQGAWIFPGGGKPSIPCMILDLSSAGAKLRVEDHGALPDEFILVMSRDRRLNRRCKVAWCKEDTIGVQFLTAKSVATNNTEKVRRFEIKLSDDAVADGDAPQADAPR